jgi:hypothetical protein
MYKPKRQTYDTDDNDRHEVMPIPHMDLSIGELKILMISLI